MPLNSQSISTIFEVLKRTADITFETRKISMTLANQLVQGRFSVWPKPLHANYLPKVTADEEAEGTEYCRQYESKLAALELDVEEFFNLQFGRHKARQRGESIQESMTRCIKSVDEYLQLLLQISVDCASQQMEKPQSLKASDPMFLEEVNVVIQPWKTTMVVDSEDKPLLTVSRHEILWDKPYPKMAEIDPPLRLEMTCTMHKHSMKRYQGLIFDGPWAVLRFHQVLDVESIFLDRQTRLDYARYRFPRHRKGFVCHLVNLLKNSDDYQRYFKYMAPAYDVDNATF